jgi:hypothetical protein
MTRPRLAAAVLLGGLTIASAAPAGAATDLAASWSAIESPAVLGELDVPPALSVGRAEIVPAAGARLFVLGAGAQPCGLLLVGKAQLRYRIEDPYSMPIARRNRRLASALALRDAEPGRGELAGPIDGAAVWGWDLQPDPAGARPVAGIELPGWLRDVLEKKLDDNPGLDLLRSAWNGQDGYRWAAFHGVDELVLDVDPSPSVRSEWLGRFHRLPSGLGKFSGRWSAEELVSQPIGRAWWEGTDREFASVETELSLVNDDRDHLAVTTRLRVRSMRAGLRLLTFALLDEMLDGNNSVRENRVTRVTVDGEPAPHVHRLGSLVILLPRALKDREQVVVEVASDGDILDRPGGDNYWRLGNEDWYPRPSRGGAEWSSFRVTAETPKPFVPFLPGEVVGRHATATGTRVETALGGPMRSVFVLAGKYSTVTEEHAGGRVHVSTYASVKEEESRRLARIVFAVRDCYETWFQVPYPFQDLQIVEVNEWGWGQAPPGFIFITREAFMTPARAKMDEESQAVSDFMTRGINERVAHEVAHAWFPHVVKVVRGEENWLSESFSDYVSAVCLRRAMGDERKGDHFFRRQVSDWKRHARELPEDSSVFLAQHVTGGDGGYRRYVQLLYGKGPLVLHALRQELVRKRGAQAGDEIFLAWIRAIVQTSKFEVGETRHLVGLLDRLTGETWQPWFERYVFGTETPAVD